MTKERFKRRAILFTSLMIVAGVAFLTATTSCSDDNEEDVPIVTVLNPTPCDTIWFDEPYNYKIEIVTNSGVGGLSMDVHHNFNHHVHGSHLPCEMDEEKEANNPYLDDWIFDLSNKGEKYVFEREITIPRKDENGEEYDYGDYHFHIYVTSEKGDLTFTTLDFKLLEKQ
ncbi:DUF4625 domain-containing protein [Marinilabiliaceae bacterium ANBcel2]|nr:DUF4625 domain-containing protein [Marinilabiliaceae bacterium ANBcel2]